jgi:homoserine kinase type II
LIEHAGIAAGVQNSNYFVTTTRGRRVLTLFENISPASLAFYLALMAHLAQRGIETRPVFPPLLSTWRPAQAFPF